MPILFTVFFCAFIRLSRGLVFDIFGGLNGRPSARVVTIFSELRPKNSARPTTSTVEIQNLHEARALYPHAQSMLRALPKAHFLS